ncbi:12-oxophytodienoate reductase [Yamadazyma tenuis]|uniref:12-oxophytodienoate reductase n=1 Tax=Candida tenuis (strain ATCC 10573 / BCRC 21748 / CBS 615 / JCM 9827 / NBRC 10315 / NRRL Y-1498 / VKM Y-70) TaxID=590646 RepID=G3B885_CANTC|nr:12-oxophytodienoate reductase [Yamadazyma tenuis ATCC 10573]XP_006687882.1 uncharacterized protein CANTEDRAFT_115171 [Yamadazyma tenuis ATCC 10573]EGV61711.1 12-oxophytodienoate reductase [Yamadazyma tenuis ATCC 10573]EGV61712.1 hypothetical protein CANTEDRAFT_115171 [Yamadazyma tenuis ATCC 10573]WEJ92944.1 12-oxophytodienoate reductase [Yamadazyma tenuis]
MSLFTPIDIGDLKLSHRVILAPLTRYRAVGNIPNKMMAEYYEQRSSKGGLLITETTCISVRGGINRNMPRIDTEEAVEGWKNIVEAVHAKGGLIFCQLNHFGRTFKPQASEYNAPVVSSSSVPIDGEMYHIPKPMDETDMKQTIEDFVNAADNAINKAGFDGIELHGANGYLLDQFIEDNINTRTDEFGGSIENRCKFPLMVLDAVIEKVGSGKVGYRISPWDVFQQANDSNPIKNFSYLCEQLEKRNIAYVHAVEARSDANGGRENDGNKSASLDKSLLKSSVAKLKPCLPTTSLISAGGWNKDNASLEGIEVDALAFGRYFISNPDLPNKLKLGSPLTPYNRDTFYTPGTAKGYTDYSSLA